LHTLTNNGTGDTDRWTDAEEIAGFAWDHLRNKLSNSNLKILQLRLVEQLPGAEVAHRLGLSHEQVRYRYHRARRELEKIGVAWSLSHRDRRRYEDPINKSEDPVNGNKNRKMEGPAQQRSFFSVSRGVNSNSPLPQGDCCVDYVFQRLELGRRESAPEWKVEWNCDGSPMPILYIRKCAIVAYAEICACEHFVSVHWPRIVNAAIAAGVAAGIATIVATPTSALPIFRREFNKELHGKGGNVADENIHVALSARQEASGPWCVCKD